MSLYNTCSARNLPPGTSSSTQLDLHAKAQELQDFQVVTDKCQLKSSASFEVWESTSESENSV